MQSRLLSIVGMFIVLTVPAFAAEKPQHAVKWNDAAETVYLPAGALSPELLSRPPAEKSAAHKKQLQLVRDAQKRISTGDLISLVDEQHLRVTHILSAAGDYDEQHHPALFALLNRVAATSEACTAKAKKYWHTKRPYLVDKKIKLYVDKIDDSPSYPSGHTAESHLLAEVISLLMPEKRDALRARADSIAWHRVQAGVHYPVDLEAGRTLADLMLGNLLANKDFQRDLNGASIELSLTKSKQP